MDTPGPDMKAQFSGDLRENPWGWSQTEGEGTELIDLVPPHKPKPLPIMWVDEKMEIRIL